MIRALLYRLAGHLPCRPILRDGAPYLERYFLFRAGPLTAYLHRFVAGDGDEEVHDHPWRAVGLCLAGGYREERALPDSRCGWRSRYRRIRPGRLNLLGLRAFHRIGRTAPESWTLFIHGRRRKGWGFLHTFIDDSGERLTVYRQPFPETASDWWRRAPRGCQLARAPLRQPDG